MPQATSQPLTIDEQVRRLEQRELDAVELAEQTIARIDEVDGELRAFAQVLRESALADARAADRRRLAGETGRLLGVPLAVKDDLDVAGHPTGRALPGPTPLATADDPAVRALRAAGAVIVGKTTLSEGALWSTTTSEAHGATLNPRFPGSTPGGSSGGSAAVVAAGLVAGALGTDVGGSVRIPAACCGVVGFKPEFDPSYRTPADLRWRGLRTRGFIAGNVAGCATLYESLGVRWDATVDGPLRIAVSASAPRRGGRIDATAETALRVAAVQLERLGHHVAWEDPPFGVALTVAAPRFLHGAAQELEGVDRASVEQRTRQAAALASFMPGLLAKAARRVAPLAQRRLAGFFERFDLLLCPTIAHRPPAAEAWTHVDARAALGRQARFAHSCPAWNLTGQPAIALPIACGQHDEVAS